MKLHVEHIALAGTTRTVSFEPGLNVLLGPISTGKSSLMRLLRVFLGAAYDPEFLPEVDATVTELAGSLALGDEQFSIRRRLVTTQTAQVEIAGGDEVLSLPAMSPTDQQSMSYGDWLLSKLDLPLLRVPSAPTRPEQSEPVRVSVNDYLRYCRLTQEQIDTDVLGSSTWYSDYKRRVVFRILYGTYDAEVARLQQRLRELGTEMRHLEGTEVAAEAFLEGTSFENRAAVDQRLIEIETQRQDLLSQSASEANEIAESSQSQELQERATGLDAELAQLRTEREREKESAASLTELRNQLETQSARLVRSIVAGESFFDFDFLVCPRCGNEVQHDRASTGHCYLCTQQEPPVPQREDLVREQARITSQIQETTDLVSSHDEAATALDIRLNDLSSERRDVGRRLDEITAQFVSDSAETATQRAAEISRLEAESVHLREYLSLFERQGQIAERLGRARAERGEVENALEQAEARDSEIDDHLSSLEEQFGNFVEAIDIPRFEGDPRAGIDRNDYQPIVNGRKIEGLSAGTRVLVNVAHLLAHHVVAPRRNVPLPGLLLIDGMTANIGHAEYDAEKIENIWTQLLQLHESMADDLQIIVAVNDLPESIDAEQFVRLELSPEDRLVPAEDLARAQADDD